MSATSASKPGRNRLPERKAAVRGIFAADLTAPYRPADVFLVDDNVRGCAAVLADCSMRMGRCSIPRVSQPFLIARYLTLLPAVRWTGLFEAPRGHARPTSRLEVQVQIALPFGYERRLPPRRTRPKNMQLERVSAKAAMAAPQNGISPMAKVAMSLPLSFSRVRDCLHVKPRIPARRLSRVMSTTTTPSVDRPPALLHATRQLFGFLLSFRCRTRAINA